MSLSVPAVRVLNSFTLTIRFSLAGRDHIFDGFAFHVLFQIVSG